jgi:hypothetical protein
MVGFYTDVTFKNPMEVMRSLSTDYLSNSVLPHSSLSSQQNAAFLMALLTHGNRLVRKFLVLTDLLITPTDVSLWCSQSRIHFTLSRYCKGHTITVC